MKKKEIPDIHIKKIHRHDCNQAEGLVVVIDVIRAFTTAAVAFSRGVEKIILVSTPEEAFDLRKKHPDYLLMGEVDGYPIEGFDFGNSPHEISKHQLQDKILVQRTSSGTQGVLGCAHAEHILTASFVIGQATLERIWKLNPDKVTFVITGEKGGGGEDWALADYLEGCLKGEKLHPEAFLKRVIASPNAQQAFNDPVCKRCSRADLDIVIDSDRFPFSTEVFREAKHLVLKPVNSFGLAWSMCGDLE